VTADRLPGDGREPSAALVAVLADRIAHLLAERIEEQLAQLLADRRLDASIESSSSNFENPSTSKRRQLAKTERGLWSAREIAEHYGVTVNFVYQHADELGCIRLGAGRRPRLRFDPRLVRERWTLIGDTLPEPARTRRRARSKTSGARRGGRPGYELIEYEERR
jgi:hypothetical protein